MSFGHSAGDTGAPKSCYLGMTISTIRLVTDSFTRRPTLDTAVSRALLQQVSDGTEPETLRFYRPGTLVAFGPQDTRSPGYRQAVDAARAGGFEAGQRLVGGRAAVYHEETIAFAWAVPSPTPNADIQARFQHIAEIMVSAFHRLGIDALIGEVPGEYCPGQFSVNTRGKKKLMGVGQRLVSRAAHIGGVVVAGGSTRIRDILLPVYNALGIAWDPDSVGSLEDEMAGVRYEDAQRAVVDEFASRYELVNASVSKDTLTLAEAVEPSYAISY